MFSFRGDLFRPHCLHVTFCRIRPETALQFGNLAVRKAAGAVYGRTTNFPYFHSWDSNFLIGRLGKSLQKWETVDWIVACYILLTSILIVSRWEIIQHAPRLLIVRFIILGALLLLPARGASWEFPSPREGVLLSTLRRLASLTRYAYPLILVLIFFEEVEYTVNALYPDQPYWFESVLINTEEKIFGELPVLWISSWTHPLLDEFMFAAYFSYFILLIGGVTVTWSRLRRTQEALRKSEATREEETLHLRGFARMITGMTLAYLATFLLFPLLPARGPWEQAALTGRLPPLDGYLFAYLISVVIQHGAVSGGCFPSSHVSGTWGLITSLPRQLIGFRRFAFPAVVLMSTACVYTRYHWALDVMVGFPVGLIASRIARRLA